MSKKFYCNLCNYSTNRQYDYNKHIKTKKHIKNKTKSSVAKNATEVANIATEVAFFATEKSSSVTCEYCGRSIYDKKFLHRHYKSCKDYIKAKVEAEKNTIIQKLQTELKRRDEELQRNFEELEELKGIEKEFLEFMKKVANSGTNNTTIKQVNMFYIVNNFTEAVNYEEIMRKPLTTNEKQYILKYGGVDGCYHVLFNRCINGLNVHQRPFHCVDDSRSKYMLRTDDSWVIDKKGKQIMEGIYPKVVELCVPPLTVNEKNFKEWETKNGYMVELTNGGKSKILSKLNETALLKNNVHLEQ